MLKLVRLTLALALMALMAVPAAAQYSICIDPGHGGTDPGAVGCGLEEADVVLDVSQRLQALIAADPDLTAIMTRSTDVFISLSGRSAYANNNGADRFVSIHSNAFNGSASGIETFHATNSSSASIDQANKIQANMVATWPSLPDRGVKSAGFSVLVNTSMPATLSELAFTDMCSADALLLADPAERQAAAVAHHDAIRASLGLGGIIIDPPPTEGFITGVVFEDVGVGTNDMTIRLPGATITATNGSGGIATAVAASPDGIWSFTVAPGNWTITASIAGYTTNTKSCVVVADETSWCSIGLFPTVVQPPDPDPQPDPEPEPQPDAAPDPQPDPPPAGPDPQPEPQPDSGPGPQPDPTPDVGPGPTPDPAPSADTGTPDTDPKGGPPDTPNGGDSGWVVGAPDDGSAGNDSEGCAATGTSPTEAWPLLALLALLALRRRRSLWPLLLAVVLAAPASAAPPTRTATNVQRLTDHDRFMAPVWSPDGAYLALSRRGLDTLWVVPAKGGTPTKIATSRRAGVAHAWSPDSLRVGFLTPEQRGHAVPALAVALDGRKATPLKNAHPGTWVVIQKDTVFLRTSQTQQRMSPPGDRFYEARLSPDGRRLVMVGLATGVHVVDVGSGAMHHLGAGTHPRFSADSRRLVFERTRDNATAITRSAVLIADLATAKPVATAVDGLPKRARRPCWSPDGVSISFDADGAIWRATLR